MARRGPIDQPRRCTEEEYQEIVRVVRIIGALNLSLGVAAVGIAGGFAGALLLANGKCPESSPVYGLLLSVTFLAAIAGSVAAIWAVCAGNQLVHAVAPSAPYRALASVLLFGMPGSLLSVRSSVNSWFLERGVPCGIFGPSRHTIEMLKFEHELDGPLPATKESEHE